METLDIIVDKMIRLLNLTPPPEGGHDRETFRKQTLLGCALQAGERPQSVINPYHWQFASLGQGALVRCTVALGFHFEGFEIAPPNWISKP